MSTNEPSTSGRPVKKQKQLRDVRHVLWMWDDSGSDLDLVEIDGSVLINHQQTVRAKDCR